MEEYKRYIGIFLNIMIPLVKAVLILILAPRLIKYFMPFVVGWIIAMLANPLVRFLERRVRIVRRHSSVLIVVAALASVIGLGYLLITQISLQITSFVSDLPELYALFSRELQEISQRFSNVFLLLPDHTQQVWKELTGNIGKTVGLLVQKAASPTVEAAGSVARSLPSILVNVIMIILSSYFFLAERDKIMLFWKKHLPKQGERYRERLKSDIRCLVGGYFLAQFKIMFVVALILFGGFLVLGVRHASLLAILVAVLDFLPLFGTGTILIPWAIFHLLSAEYVLAVGMALLYILTQAVRQLIQPKIVGDTMGLPPLVTLILLYLGFKLHGISGMILAVPVGILVLKFYQYGAFDSFLNAWKAAGEEIQKLRRRGRERDEI